MEILRGAIFHTPANAFESSSALHSYTDGALAIDGGCIVACGDYAGIREAHPEAPVRDLRGGFILPGFIDTHIHFPQVRIIGGLGYSLLEWLDRLTLPEEAKLADAGYAGTIAGEFVAALAAHGTTTALVFGSHFAEATAALFQAAAKSGLRVIGGLVLADRGLRPELHQTPDAAYRESRALIERFHNRGRLGYAVMPRFAVAASEAMLQTCQALLREDSTLRFTTHLNENPAEIEEVLRLFPWTADYLAVYERYGLISRRAVLAHNIHTNRSELHRLAWYRASIAHCPCSNAALGSGVFGMRRHLEGGVPFALGTDVGAGTGFGMMKEALQAYLMQRILPQPMSLTPAQMLYLATRAGAEALALEEETGDFTPGKAADFVYLRAPKASPLEGVLRNAEDPERMLSALFTLGGAESVREVRVEGDLVFEAGL